MVFYVPVIQVNFPCPTVGTNFSTPYCTDVVCFFLSFSFFTSLVSPFSTSSKASFDSFTFSLSFFILNPVSCYHLHWPTCRNSWWTDIQWIVATNVLSRLILSFSFLAPLSSCPFSTYASLSTVMQQMPEMLLLKRRRRRRGRRRGSWFQGRLRMLPFRCLMSGVLCWQDKRNIIYLFHFTWLFFHLKLYHLLFVSWRFRAT